MKQSFYICPKCGSIVAKVKDSGVALSCCGGEMTEIIAGTVEAAREKHIPVYAVENGVVKVTVGSVEHPMTEPHYIEWISLQTKHGNQRKVLTPSDAPKADFAILDGDEVEAVYAYCNLHGLWQG